MAHVAVLDQHGGRLGFESGHVPRALVAAQQLPGWPLTVPFSEV